MWTLIIVLCVAVSQSEAHCEVTRIYPRDGMMGSEAQILSACREGGAQEAARRERVASRVAPARASFQCVKEAKA